MSSSDSEDLIPRVKLAPHIQLPQSDAAPISTRKTITLLGPDYISPEEFKDLYYSEQNSLPRRGVSKTRLKNDDPTSADFRGPWAHYSDEVVLNQIQEVDELQSKKLEEFEERRQQKIQESKENPQPKDYYVSNINLIEPQVIRHSKKEKDYQNRSFIFPPSELKSDSSHTCYLPKKAVHTYAGHSQGVQCVKFIPTYGHLLLSCSLDHTVKIWDTLNTRKCIQTYIGHSNAVRDLCWNMDGTGFLSSSYDRVIRYWDTETGKVICTFNCRRIPYCVRFNPNPMHQSAFIAGTANKRIVQFDVNTGKKVQNYDEHLGAVSTLCFVDDNTKFVSASDDKKVFLWEFGIPIVAKHISEPNLNPISYTQLHPAGRHFVGQCLDNKIVVFEARGGFRLNRRKFFSGHTNGGYSSAVAFSPDGRYAATGDSQGKAWFWDWKTTKNYKTLEAHDSVCIGIDWHPIFASTVATYSWDGLIKLWD